MSNIESQLNSIEQKLNSILEGHKSLYVAGTEEELDLRELIGSLWQGKWIVVAFAFVVVTVVALVSITIPNVYESEVLLAPAEDDLGSGGRGGQLGGLASLAGLNLGGASDKTDLAIEILKSREFIYKFVDRHDLLVPLMASIGWDREENKLLIDSDIYDSLNREWVRKVSASKSAKPTAQEAYKNLLKRVLIQRDKITGFVTIGVEFYSPDIAKNWVDVLVADVNEEMRARDVRQAEKAIEYLKQQIEITSVTDMQSVFYQLIEEQTKIIMFANVRDEYVFKTIDRAVSPERKSGPNRLLLIFVAGIFGGLLGIGVVLFRRFVNNQS